jgi:hypothetical protein
VRQRGGTGAAAGTIIALAVARSRRSLLFAPQQIRPQRGGEALSPFVARCDPFCVPVGLIVHGPPILMAKRRHAKQ